MLVNDSDRFDLDYSLFYCTFFNISRGIFVYDFCLINPPTTSKQRPAFKSFPFVWLQKSLRFLRAFWCQALSSRRTQQFPRSLLAFMWPKSVDYWRQVPISFKFGSLLTDTLCLLMALVKQRLFNLKAVIFLEICFKKSRFYLIISSSVIISPFSLKTR